MRKIGRLCAILMIICVSPAFAGPATPTLELSGGLGLPSTPSVFTEDIRAGNSLNLGAGPY